MKNSVYFFLLAGVLATAQVRMTNSGANISSVNSSAFIDASSQSTNNATLGVGKGLVFPRVNLSTFTFVGTAGIPNNFPTRFDGMIVYNTSIGGVAGAGATEGTLSEGYWYYYNKSNSITGGTWKKLQNDNNLGSNSVVLNGVSFERAALIGDVTAAANSNLTTIAPDAVTSSKILDGTIATSDIANNAVTIAKLPSGATTTTFLRGDGTWVTPIDTNTNIYTNDGALNSNRTVSLATNALNFTSTATSGSSHFTVDGTTLNVDALNNRLGINTATPVSSFDINGSMGVPLTTSSSDITLNESHAIVRVNTSSNDVTITLPSASTTTNRIYSIIKTDASNNKIIFNSTISASGYTFTQVNVPGEYKIQSDGNSWNLIR